MTDKGQVKQTLKALLDEDAALKKEEDRIARRRAQLGSAIMSLLALENDQAPEFTGGLAEAIRTVLQADPNQVFTASDVRTGLRILKFNMDEMSNPLASIHSILKRLFDSGEVVKLDTADGSTGYSWKGTPRRHNLEALLLMLGATPPKSSATDALVRAAGKIESPKGVLPITPRKEKKP